MGRWRWKDGEDGTKRVTATVAALLIVVGVAGAAADAATTIGDQSVGEQRSSAPHRAGSVADLYLPNHRSTEMRRQSHQVATHVAAVGTATAVAVAETVVVVAIAVVAAGDLAAVDAFFAPTLAA